MTAPEPPTRPTTADLLRELEALGDERVRARNRKLGAGEAQSGVRMGDIRVLAKRVGRDPLLARELWASGHLEARLLAILLLQPRHVDALELERMICDARLAQLADWLQAYLVKDHPAAEGLRERFLDDPDPWVARQGGGRLTQRR
jgi:3-methyladenine DNA glycosylase AlkD